MKTACFIPIKSNSERVPGKNLRLLNNKELYKYICEHVKEIDLFDDVYVDTNNSDVAKYANSIGFKVIERLPELANNTANGNDLLLYHYQLFPNYDYYFQVFATAPYMQPQTIKKCYDILTNSNIYDSCFTAIENHSFYWYAGNPINYRPGILPRSQDVLPVIEETTGLYGISNKSLAKYRCRIGMRPYIHIVNKFEAIDINTEDDFKIAEQIGKIIYNL